MNEEQLGPLPVAIPESEDAAHEPAEPTWFVLDRKDPEQQKLAKMIGWGRVKALADQDARARQQVERNNI